LKPPNIQICPTSMSNDSDEDEVNGRWCVVVVHSLDAVNWRALQAKRSRLALEAMRGSIGAEYCEDET